MGTNYYTYEKHCPHCGGGGEEIHIGKSSCGWVFHLHGYHPPPEGPSWVPAGGLNDWDSWAAFLVGRAIRDEYGDEVSLEDFRQEVTEREHPNGLQKMDSYVYGAKPRNRRDDEPTWNVTYSCFS